MLTASIVLYKENYNTLKKTIDSLLNTPIKKRIYLIDNSPNDNLRNQYIHEEIIYIFIGKNIGFGSGHNLILEKIKQKSDFHLVLNPDVTFIPTVIPSLIQQLQKEPGVALIAPKVLLSDGKQQHTCRKYPSILGMVFRRIGVFKKYTLQRTYQNLDLNSSFYPEFIHGCFLLFKTTDLLTLKGFDERYFLYMEDADICKKVDALGKNKLYYPKESIVHIHRKGSSKSVRLFLTHLFSAIKYFLKWGV